MTAGPPEAKIERIWRRAQPYPAVAILACISSFMTERIRELPTPLEFADRCKRELTRLEGEYEIRIKSPVQRPEEPPAELSDEDERYRSAICGKGFAQYLRNPGDETLAQYLDRIEREFKRGKYETDQIE